MLENYYYHQQQPERHTTTMTTTTGVIQCQTRQLRDFSPFFVL